MGARSPFFHSEINSLSVRSVRNAECSALLLFSSLLWSALLYCTVLCSSVLFCTLLCSVYFLAKKCPFLAKKQRFLAKKSGTLEDHTGLHQLLTANQGNTASLKQRLLAQAPSALPRFLATRQVLMRNRALSARKIYSQITLVQLCGIALRKSPA